MPGDDHDGQFGPDLLQAARAGLFSLFTAIETHHGAAILGDTMEILLPRDLVMIPFSPSLSMRRVMVGLPEHRPDSNAEILARFLCEVAQASRKGEQGQPMMRMPGKTEPAELAPVVAG